MTPSATDSVSFVTARATQVHPSLRGADADRNLAVRIAGLNHTYGQGETSTQVLFDNNLQLARGEIVIMTGRSGSGKTTLLTLIGGLRTTQEGSCQVLGQELLGMSSAALVALRRQIGFIFQAHNLFGSLTAVQNVRMALELHRRDGRANRDAAEEILKAVGLGHRLRYKPDELSGGQRQRVAIARALVNKPKLILADEPTAALDEESSKLVVDLLKKLAREEQSTILIVTHDNRILNAADRIVNMSGGRIVSNVLVQESAEICKFLHECPLFAPITPSNLTQIADKMDLEAFARGGVIVRQGDAGDKFYVIRRGSVKVETTRDGQTRQLATLTSGGFFGEAALVRGEPRNATVTALDDVECYTLDKQEFDQVRKSSLEFADELRKVLFERQ